MFSLPVLVCEESLLCSRVILLRTSAGEQSPTTEAPLRTHPGFSCRETDRRLRAGSDELHPRHKCARAPVGEVRCFLFFYLGLWHDRHTLVNVSARAQAFDQPAP